MADKTCDLLLDYFNNLLSPDQKEEFEAHLKHCDDCKEELEELEHLTEDLPYMSDPVDPPEGMKKRVLSSVLSENQAVQKTPPLKEDPVPSIKEKQTISQPKKVRKWMNPMMAAVLTLSLIGNGAAIVYISTNSGNSTTQTTPEETNNESLDTIENSLVLSSSAGNQASGSALMIAQNDKMNLVIEAKNLPSLEGEETYQVWVLKDEEPQRAGTFVTNEQGTGAVSYLLDNGQKWDTIAITKEPDAHSQTPKGDILLSSPI